MASYPGDMLCRFHDMDGDLRGWRLVDPEISCPACRRLRLFSPAQLAAYDKEQKAVTEATAVTLVLGKSTVRAVCTQGLRSSVNRFYALELLAGDWPADDEIIEKFHPPFGGVVTKIDARTAELLLHLD